MRECLTGKRFGNLVVVGFSHSHKKNGSYLKCMCDCGNPEPKVVLANNLNRDNSTSCGKCSRFNNIGKVFGRLTVVKFKFVKNKNSHFECKCDCGNPDLKVKSLPHLKNTKSPSCGACSRFEHIGKKFGRLTPINFYGLEGGFSYFMCKCDCGNPELQKIKLVNLNAERTGSCGNCYKFDMIGKKFGKLTVLKFSHTHADYNHSYFKCKCGCGKIKCISGSNLKNAYSCGCEKKTAQNDLFNTINSIFTSKQMYQNYRQFLWLRNPDTNYPLEVDIYIPDLMIAIEYDGEQHFNPVRFGGISKRDAAEKLRITKERDLLKNSLIFDHIKNGGKDIKYFIRFKYDEKIDKENIIVKLQKQGVCL